MFKEAVAGIFILAVFYLAYRLLWKKNRKAAAVIFALILFLSCAANMIYNAAVMFPDFYMDIVNGRFRYGTFSGNLFAYSDAFMFQDEIIFPVLRGRTVYLDADAGFYEKFISLYAENYERLPVSAQQKKAVCARGATDFDFSHEFSCMGIMDYVTDDIPQALAPAFEEEAYPMLYINTSSLDGQQQLAAVMDADYNLYLMSKDYYEETAGGMHNE